jgi:HD-like signal output (HDOD) protein
VELESALVCQQAGTPQQVLAKFLSLQLNYQCGLSVVTTQELGRAATTVALQRTVRCAFVIQSQAITDPHLVGALGRGGVIPVFLILPARSVEVQRPICAGTPNVHLCAWEAAFGSAATSLQHVVARVLSENGVGSLFRELDETPYPALRRRVERRLRSISTLPTLPEIVLRLMRLVNDPSTTTAQLEELLCRDPAIVMKLLQVARSPVFSPGGRHSSMSLSEIIVRLGMKKVAAIAQQIKMINSLVRPEDSEFDLRRFWTHSVGCAIVADRLHERRLVPLPGEVSFSDYWIGALLHDIGWLVLGFFFWDWFARVLAQAPRCGHQLHQAEAELGDMASHERVAQLLAVNADLGEGLVGALGRHHTTGPRPAPLVCLVHLADNLCKDLRLGYTDEESGVYDPHVLAACGIDHAAVVRARDALGPDLAGEVHGLVEQCL